MTVTHQIFSIIFVFDVRKELWSPCTIGWITLTVKCTLWPSAKSMNTDSEKTVESFLIHE